VGAVGVVVGVDMIVIFLSLWFGLWCSADHNFPAVATLTGSGEWWVVRLNRGSTDRGTRTHLRDQPISRCRLEPPTPVPASVAAVQLNAICVADCAAAVRPEGTEGFVVSTGAGGGGGDGLERCASRSLNVA
jgi:hypothetical protein